jgi:ATP-binding cassette subfamily B protein
MGAVNGASRSAAAGFWRQRRTSASLAVATVQSMWASSASWTSVSAVLFVIVALLGVVQLVLVGVAVDGAGGGAGELVGPLAGLAVVVVVVTVLGRVASYGLEEVGQRLRLDAQRRVMDLNMGPTGVAHLEDPTYQGFLALAQAKLAKAGAANSVGGVTATLASVVSGAARCVLLGVLFRWWAPLVLASSAVVVRWWTSAQLTNLLQGWQRDAEHIRRADYLRDLTMAREAAKEVRVFGLAGWLLDQFTDTWVTAMRPVWAGRRRLIAAGVAVSAVMVAALAVVLAALGQARRSGEIDTATLVVLAQCALGVGQAAALTNAHIYGRLSAEALLAIRRAERVPLVPSADLPSGRHDAGGTPTATVVFDDVTFHYPGSPTPVLAGFSLSIRAGTSVAIVGENGAGKTTIVKLLCRLHDPDSGRVLVDDADIRSFDIESWRSRVAVVFQDFTRWKLSLRDNVGFGALARRGDDGAVLAALGRAQSTPLVERLPDGIDSILSRAFLGGVELSGGEWQRIALARALFQVDDGGILVLDEPTASLDVRAERALFDTLLDVTRGVTTILVSHRFSTVRRADRIVVVEGGRVVEDGSHEALLAAGGRYARMFRLQAAAYTDPHPAPGAHSAVTKERPE